MLRRCLIKWNLVRSVNRTKLHSQIISHSISWKPVPSFSSVNHVSSRSIRAFSTASQNVNVEVDQLCKKSLEFLSLNQNQGIRSSKICSTLIEQWYKYLSRETESKGFDPYRYLTGGLIESEREELSRFMHIVDDLAHRLLDLREMDGRNSGDDRTQYRPLIHLVLTLWSHAPPSLHSGDKAQDILDRINRIYEKYGDESIRPTDKEYGCVIHAWANTIDHDDIDGGTKALQVLEQLLTMKDVEPSRIAYNTTLHALASRGRLTEVENLLDRMESECKSGNGPCPDVFTYSTIMNAYQKSNEIRKGVPIAKRAEALIHRMLRRYNETGELSIRPNQYTFGSVIALFALSKSPNAAKDADKILQFQISLYENEKIDANICDSADIKEKTKYSLAPGVPHFVSVLLAYSNSKQAGAVQRIEELLMQMERLDDAGVPDMKPTYQCFVIYLNALSKSRDPKAANKAERVLDTIESMCLNKSNDSFDLNNYGYNLVIDAWARSQSNGRADKAEAIILRMNELHQSTGIASLKPDKFTYTSYIDAIINDGDPGFEERCLKVLHDMNRESDENAHGDTVTYNLVTKALVKVGKFDEASALLESISNKFSAEGITICYNTLMHGLGRNTDDETSVVKALDIFHRIEKPTLFSYGIIIDTISRSNLKDKTQQAENIYHRFFSHRKDFGRRLTPEIFNIIMNIHAKSYSNNKVRKVLQILQDMKSVGVQPSILTMNTVLNACSKLSWKAPEEFKREALDVAAAIFREIQSNKDLIPDAYTYASLLDTCSLISNRNEREKTVRAIFASCAKDGYVNGIVLSRLRSISRIIFEESISTEEVDKYINIEKLNLDPSWTRNIK